jgi:hypothetical protein
VEEAGAQGRYIQARVNGVDEDLQRAELLLECGFRACLGGGISVWCWYWGLGARGADEERSAYI